jgi:polyhydroxyalkanoate synthesis regulator phasin
MWYRLRVKGQSYHQRKIRISETPKVDYEELKTRTIAALRKLGEQKFSGEPGGYSLENWMKGVNVLLDDFEEKIGPARLSSEYAARRRFLTEFISKPVDVSSIDQEISELRQKMADIQAKLDDGRAGVANQIDELKKEQSGYSDELAREKKKAAQPVEQNSGSLLKRLFRGSSPTPAEESKAEVERLESKLRELPDRIREQQKLMRSIDEHSPDSPMANYWRSMEELRAKAAALEAERTKRVDLVKERTELTGSIAQAISAASPATAE